MSKNIKEDVIYHWWRKAEESLDAARREFRAQSYIFAVNRLYYTVFYAVTAVLLKRDMSFKKHSGVRAAFHRELIKSGLLDKSWAHFYDQLFEDRQEGDYIAISSFDSDYVESQLINCEKFISELKSRVAL